MFLPKYKKHSPKGSIEQTEKENLAADNILLKAFETGELSVLPVIIAHEFINHQAMGDLTRTFWLILLFS